MGETVNSLTPVDQWAYSRSAYPPDFPAAAVVASEPRGWRRADDALRAIRLLGDDWDGNGARAPLAGVVDAAIRIGRRLASQRWPEPASLSASPSGSIVMSWQEHNQYLEIEVVSPTRAEWMSVGESGAAIHGTLEPERPPTIAFWH